MEPNNKINEKNHVMKNISITNATNKGNLIP